MPRAVEKVRVSNPDNLERVLLNPELFVGAIPNASVLKSREMLLVRVPFRLFLFSTRDDYRVTFYAERDGYAYEFNGRKSRLVFKLKPEGDELQVEMTYEGRLKRLVGLEFRRFAEELAVNLEGLIDELSAEVARKVEGGVFEVNFDDPADFKRKLYGFLLEGTEDLLVSEEALQQVAGHLVGESGVYYISGTSLDGRKRFQLVLQDGKPTSVKFVENGRLRVARLSLNPNELERIIRDVSGDFVVNIWRKVGRV